jgi:hypothetical protein
MAKAHVIESLIPSYFALDYVHLLSHPSWCAGDYWLIRAHKGPS